jgi:hypothetical protein
MRLVCSAEHVERHGLLVEELLGALLVALLEADVGALGFDLRVEAGTLLGEIDLGLLDIGLQLRNHLPLLDGVAAIDGDGFDDAGDRARELDDLGGLDHAIECRHVVGAGRPYPSHRQSGGRCRHHPFDIRGHC